MDTAIRVQVGNEVKVLEGEELKAFLDQKKLDDAAMQSAKAAQTAKEEARTSALAKLAALGLTEAEIASL
jgi:hypothetical protein